MLSLLFTAMSITRLGWSIILSLSRKNRSDECAYFFFDLEAKLSHEKLKLSTEVPRQGCEDTYVTYCDEINPCEISSRANPFAIRYC